VARKLGREKKVLGKVTSPKLGKNHGKGAHQESIRKRTKVEELHKGEAASKKEEPWSRKAK